MCSWPSKIAKLMTVSSDYQLAALATLSAAQPVVGAFHYVVSSFLSLSSREARTESQSCQMWNPRFHSVSIRTISSCCTAESHTNHPQNPVFKMFLKSDRPTGQLKTPTWDTPVCLHSKLLQQPPHLLKVHLLLEDPRWWQGRRLLHFLNLLGGRAIAESVGGLHFKQK